MASSSENASCIKELDLNLKSRSASAHLWRAVSRILRSDCPSRKPLNRNRAPILTGVNSSLSSKILRTIASTDVGSSGMMYLHSR